MIEEALNCFIVFCAGLATGDVIAYWILHR